MEAVGGGELKRAEIRLGGSQRLGPARAGSQDGTKALRTSEQSPQGGPGGLQRLSPVCVDVREAKQQHTGAC